jgi:hypothetical protein
MNRGRRINIIKSVIEFKLIYDLREHISPSIRNKIWKFYYEPLSQIEFILGRVLRLIKNGRYK